MVLDTSAILAVLLDEPEHAAFDCLIEDDPRRFVRTITQVEVTFVIETRKGELGREQLDHST